MKQVLQHCKTGRLTVEDLPTPLLRPGGILVQSRVSLISAGTERAALELGQKSLIGMARQRPDLVAQAREKLRRDGLRSTLTTIRDRLDRQTPLGYSICGEVTDVGARAGEFSRGQRVACAGAGYASHAEVNFVPRLLATAVADDISDEAAAYTTVGAIAMQGIRNAEAEVGEVVVVIGLGLVGQLTVQLLRAAGCRAIGLDLSPDRVALAQEHGAEAAFLSTDADAESAILDLSRGRGADAVLITAATKSNAPLEAAARLARDRGRVVMVGVTGMEIPRTPFFQKELKFIVSRSYGPGRYDEQYEQHGHDYPIGYVPWTENRNMEAFLDLARAGKVRPEVCTTHRFPIDRAIDAYDLVLSGKEPYLGVLLTYPKTHSEERPRYENTIQLSNGRKRSKDGTFGVSLVGAGRFACSVLLPRLASQSSLRLRGVVTSSGATAKSAGRRFGFAYCTTDERAVFEDAGTEVVFISTRHSQHAASVCQALEAGKTVFVEKPLAISPDQLAQVAGCLRAGSPGLMVGFNRRFAPLARRMQAHFEGQGPLRVQYRCNAGAMPTDHWIADPDEGGRIIGEACHFIDFFAFLTGANPRSVFAAGVDDDAAITVEYSDGSVCQLAYASNGPRTLGKERVEVIGGGRAAVLDDFRRLELQSPRRRPRRIRKLAADKGHTAEIQAFLAALESGAAMPIPVNSLIETTLASFAAVESLRRREPVLIAELEDELLSRLAPPHPVCSQ